jgi:hypothetical protein
MPPSPFAALSLIVAPAVLTNASSVLIMSTSNRLARATDRAREFAMRLERPGADHQPAAPLEMRELDAALKRALLLIRALRFFYSSLGGFASAALLSLVGAVMAGTTSSGFTRTLEVVALGAGLLAVGGLVAGAFLLVTETRLAVDILRERAADIRARIAAPPQPPALG